MLAERVRVVHNGHPVASDPIPGGIERRGAPRFQTRTVGKIFPAAIYAPMPCLITDISATGARLELLSGWFNPYKDPQGIGLQFRLVMSVDKLEVPCAIVRINENEMGVRFLRAQQPLPRSLTLIPAR